MGPFRKQRARPNFEAIVKRKVLPFPRTSPSTVSSPPMSATSCALMARPNPVPPYNLVFESAWENASKMSRCFSSGMPMPVSIAVNSKLARSAQMLTSDDKGRRTLLRELNGVHRAD